MNILITSAGRRNYLVQYFKEALKNSGLVFTADASPEAPALQEADRSYVVPLVKEEKYFDTLLKICQKHQVHLLVSLNDLELPLLAMKKQYFLDIGTIPVISSLKVVDLCFDKWQMMFYLKNLGLSVPETFLLLDDAQEAVEEKRVRSSFVVKPRWGTASIGIEYPDDLEELKIAYSWAKKCLSKTFLADISSTDEEQSVLIQEKLHGQEYGLDVVNDLDGRYVCTLVRKKLAIRAGETDRAVTVKDEELEKLGKRIGMELGHVGLLDCDIIINNEGVFVLELNPRFGGGYPFSHMAGANIPAALMAWARGEEPDENWFKVREGVKSAKCDRIVEIKDLPSANWTRY